MTPKTDENEMIERPDGSTISYGKLPPEKQMEHDLVVHLCGGADTLNASLTKFKRDAIFELIGTKALMFDQYGIKKGGDGGNLSLRSVCGRLLVKLTVSKQVTFGPELEAAKALIDEFMEAELAKGGSEFIREIVEKVFKLNAKGRIDTGGILGLRDHKFEDPTWNKAMKAIEAAICRDSETTYVNFYHVDPSNPEKGKAETRIPLDLAKV